MLIVAIKNSIGEKGRKYNKMLVWEDHFVLRMSTEA